MCDDLNECDEFECRKLCNVNPVLSKKFVYKKIWYRQKRANEQKNSKEIYLMILDYNYNDYYTEM